jgi:hypothetical protein
MSSPFTLRASLFILATACLLASPVHATDCTKDLIGEWNWYTGAVVTIQADHKLLYDGNVFGSWTCDTPDGDVVRLEWNSGFTDRIKVKGDRIEGTNNQGGKITAQRKKKSDQFAGSSASLKR